MLFGSYEMMMNTMRDQLLAQQQASAVARPAASPSSDMTREYPPSLVIIQGNVLISF
jgi:hypothetical protein